MTRSQRLNNWLRISLLTSNAGRRERNLGRRRQLRDKAIPWDSQICRSSERSWAGKLFAPGSATQTDIRAANVQPRQRLALPLVARSAFGGVVESNTYRPLPLAAGGGSAGKLINSARQSRASARKPDAARGNHLPEAGFHYFPSPESSDDNEIIANLFVYLSVAVDEWPRYRRWLQKTAAKSPRECDDIEANAVNVFREVRDAITMAINADNPALMSQPRLLDRLTHAHAYMALHADPASLAG